MNGAPEDLKLKRPANTKNKLSKGSLAEAVSLAVTAMTDKLRAGELKPTMAEFVRLLDLQRELVTEDVRHIKVTWVDSLNGTESTTEV